MAYEEKMKPSVNTCAGKSIKAAVDTYSSYLISGYNLNPFHKNNPNKTAYSASNKIFMES